MTDGIVDSIVSETNVDGRDLKENALRDCYEHPSAQMVKWEGVERTCV